MELAQSVCTSASNFGRTFAALSWSKMPLLSIKPDWLPVEKALSSPLPKVQILHHCKANDSVLIILNLLLPFQPFQFIIQLINSTKQWLHLSKSPVSTPMA
jgi:hypothetical protein